MLLGERGDFFVGEWPYHMYVEYQNPPPIVPGHEVPMVLYHGGCTTGTSYWTTPDGRPSWAPHFAEHGWKIYVVDWPGHGRSGFPADYATMPYQRVVDAGLALAERIGPHIIMTGSMSGPPGWMMADLAPQQFRAIVAWEPGPPANLQPVNAPRLGDKAWFCPEDEPWRYEDLEYYRKRFTAGPLFPHAHWEQNLMREVPESAVIMNQRYNKDGSGLHISDPPRFKDLPKLIITSENSMGHPREQDARTAEFVGAEHVFLPDVGMPGHCHTMRADEGNLEIADLILRWLEKKGF